jgi:hypothetical protein
MVEQFLHSHIRLHGIVRNCLQIKHRDNFTLSLDRELGGPQRRFGYCEEEKNRLLLPAIESRVLGSPVRSLVATL